MSSTSSVFSPTQLFQDFLGKFHSRKLLIHNSPNQQTITTAPPHPAESSSLNKNVLMVLSVLICSVIFAAVLNSLVRCVLRCLRSVSSESSTDSSALPSDNKGIKKKVLKTFPVVNYSAELKLPGLDTECVICLSDFSAGERVRLLSKCNHGFHVRCIDKWLSSNSSCPRCRQCVNETCEKIVASSKQARSSSEHSMPAQEAIVSIWPLEPEGIIRNSGGLA